MAPNKTRAIKLTLHRHVLVTLNVYCGIMHTSGDEAVNAALGSRVIDMVNEQTPAFQTEYYRLFAAPEPPVKGAGNWHIDVPGLYPEPNVGEAGLSLPLTKIVFRVTPAAELRLRTFSAMTGEPLSSVAHRAIRRQVRHIMGRTPEDWAAFWGAFRLAWKQAQ